MKTRFLNALLAVSALFSMGTTSKAEALLASMKATGMAATAIAYPQDAIVAAYNPAGSTAVGDRFDLGFGMDRTINRGELTGNRVPFLNRVNDGSERKFMYTGDFGINKTFCWNYPVSFGLVVYNRNLSKTTYTAPLPLIGTTKPGLEYLHATVSPYAAIRFNRCLSFGVSLNYMIQRLKVNGVERFAAPLNNFSSISPNHVTNQGYDYSTGIGVTLGWYGEIHPRVALGVTYQPETSMDHFDKYKGLLAQKGKFNIPQKVTGGIAIKVTPCMTLAFDVQHDFWKEIKSLHNPLFIPVPILAPSPKFGEKNGAGFGWRSQTFYRIGADYKINPCWTVRAGFRHANTPIRRSQTAVNLLTCDTLQDYFTCGTTVQIGSCNEISVLYAHGFKHTVKGRNSVPRILGGGEINLSQYRDVFGISWGHLF